MEISNSEKMYEEAEAQSLNADKMCDFWGEQALKGLMQAIEGVEDLSYALLVKNNEDAKILDNIRDSLSDYLALARDRYRFWFRKSIEYEKELREWEKIIESEEILQ